MTVGRRGWRKLAVNGETYVWRTKGSDAGVHVRVTTPLAFERGPHVRQIHFCAPHDISVTPGLVQRAIALVAESADSPRGVGDDLSIPRWAVATISGVRVEEGVSVAMIEVERALARRDPGSWVAAHALLVLGAWLLRGGTHLRAFVDERMRVALGRTETEPGIETLLEDVARSAAPGRADEASTSAQCVRRSAVAWLLTLAPEHVCTRVHAAVSLDALDAAIELGEPARRVIPSYWLVPESHHWWRWV